MPTWNPVIIAFGREKVLKTAFRKNINLAKKKKKKKQKKKKSPHSVITF